MVNGEKKEVMRENPVKEKVYLGNDILAADECKDGFYGGTDMRINRIRIVTDKPLPID